MTYHFNVNKKTQQYIVILKYIITLALTLKFTSMENSNTITISLDKLLKAYTEAVKLHNNPEEKGTIPVLQITKTSSRQDINGEDGVEFKLLKEVVNQTIESHGV